MSKGDMTDLEWRPVTVRLGDLAHWAENPVTLTKAQATKLLKSTEKLGRMQTLAIGPSNGDGKHPLYDGHQRVNVWGAAFGMGLEVNALESNRPLTDEERHAVPVMLRTATGSFDWQALAGWDAEKLTAWGMDEDLLKSWNVDGVNLREMLTAEQSGPQDAEPQIDRAEELNKKWQVKPGDLWRIGEHRLLCGDSTKREDVERVMDVSLAMVMATDPPYGVAYDNSGRPNPGVAKPRVANDELTDGPAMQDFLERMLKAALPNMDKHAAFYFWHPMLTQGTYVAAAAAAAAGILIHRQIIWVKPVLLLGRGDYHWRHELCFYGWQKGNRPPFYGRRNQDTIWEVGSVTQAERKAMNHATPKPLGLWDKPILNHTKHGEIVYEPFLGSGTTIVACQNLGRKCRAIEISPAYVAVCLERMATAFPGIEIERIT